MLISKSIADRIVSAAAIRRTDMVLEIGTGRGMLTGLLSKQSKHVVSFEIDKEMYLSSTKALSSCKNVEVIFDDALNPTNSRHFDVCVTSLPYSQSVRFMRWLALKSGTFRSTVAVVQSEFATKLCSENAREAYRAVSVLAQLSFHVERLFQIGKTDFRPMPRVKSEAIKISPREDIKQPFFNGERIASLNYLFSFRRKMVAKALKEISKGDQDSSLDEKILTKRVESLTPNEFAAIIEWLESKY